MNISRVSSSALKPEFQNSAFSKLSANADQSKTKSRHGFFITFVGLRAADGQQLANYTPAFTLAIWFFAYYTLSSRFSKMAIGLDHNLSPREDFSKYDDAAVQAGKLSRRRLQIKRMQSAP